MYTLILWINKSVIRLWFLTIGPKMSHIFTIEKVTILTYLLIKTSHGLTYSKFKRWQFWPIYLLTGPEGSKVVTDSQCILNTKHPLIFSHKIILLLKYYDFCNLWHTKLIWKLNKKTSGSTNQTCFGQYKRCDPNQIHPTRPFCHLYLK